ncbi:hypothetical protein L9F63_011493, partial [Diploptera punctata]
QQIHAQQLPHAAHGPSLPMGPHPGLPASAPLTAAAAAAAAAAQQQHPLLKPADLHNPRDPNDIKGPSSLPEERLRSSVSPAEREKYRSRSPDVEPELKRRKEDKLGGHESDGEKSDQDLVVDVANETSGTDYNEVSF